MSYVVRMRDCTGGEDFWLGKGRCYFCEEEAEAWTRVFRVEDAHRFGSVGEAELLWFWLPPLGAHHWVEEVA